MRAFIDIVESNASDPRYDELGSWAEIVDKEDDEHGKARFWAHMPSKRIFCLSGDAETEHVWFTRSAAATELGLPPTDGSYDHLLGTDWVAGNVCGSDYIEFRASTPKVGAAFLRWVMASLPLSEATIDFSEGAPRSVVLNNRSLDLFVRSGHIPRNATSFD